MVWCNILLGTESLIVGCIYRPPHAKREVNMEINNAITKAKTICDKKNHQGLVIGGDFNHPNIIWREDGGSFSKKKGQPSVELVNCITSNELTQLVKNPTFRTNVLDLVITDDPDRIFKIDYGPPIGATKKNSLHGTLTWNYTLRAEKMNMTGITRRNYHKCYFSKFSEFLTSLVNLSCNPDSAYDELVNMYQAASKECVPLIIPIHLKQPNIINVDYTFSVSNVAKALNQLDTRKSIGPDGVHPIVLKIVPVNSANT
jgi:hypothetical protein